MSTQITTDYITAVGGVITAIVAIFSLILTRKKAKVETEKATVETEKLRVEINKLKAENEMTASKPPISDTNLCEFFGGDILTEDFKIVYSVFSRISPEKSNEEIYEKRLSTGITFKFDPPRFIVTEPTIRGISHFLQEFSKYREKPFVICTDNDALYAIHTSTFLSIGGPLSNELSDLALKAGSNKFIRFSLPQDTLRNYASIESISSNEKFERRNEFGHDYGIILKINNIRAPGKYIFVCAGIGSLGTSGAVWYLTNFWRKLYEVFKAKEFGIVIETVCNQDNMATCIYPEYAKDRLR